MNERYKYILFAILQVLWFIVKALVTVTFVVLAMYDKIIVDSFLWTLPGKDGEIWPYVVSLTYLILLYVVSVYLICWTIFGLKHLHYIILGICLIVLYLSANAAPLQHARARDICFDHGKVWDGDLQKCRDDCLTWNEKEGCVPL